MRLHFSIHMNDQQIGNNASPGLKAPRHEVVLIHSRRPTHVLDITEDGDQRVDCFTTVNPAGRNPRFEDSSLPGQR